MLSYKQQKSFQHSHFLITGGIPFFYLSGFFLNHHKKQVPETKLQNFFKTTCITFKQTFFSWS